MLAAPPLDALAPVATLVVAALTLGAPSPVPVGRVAPADDMPLQPASTRASDATTAATAYGRVAGVDGWPDRTASGWTASGSGMRREPGQRLDQPTHHGCLGGRDCGDIVSSMVQHVGGH
ncbi:hypothetical protein GCM10009810_20090 [Nostocoides vanveenii]|uniref:Uncharacterized protein n=1 Tax=Nostocoides vanveenii TaxID=330835 RepID=A0ABN2KMR8_9MICO